MMTVDKYPATRNPTAEYLHLTSACWWHIRRGLTLVTIKHTELTQRMPLEIKMDIKDTCWSLDQLANSTVLAQSNREAAASASNAILSLRNMLDLPATAVVDDIVKKVHQLMEQLPSAS